jgi:hypothetical protein
MDDYLDYFAYGCGYSGWKNGNGTGDSYSYYGDGDGDRDGGGWSNATGKGWSPHLNKNMRRLNNDNDNS